MSQADYQKSWELAFGASVLEIEVEGVTVGEIYAALQSAPNDLRKQQKALLHCFAGRPWKWSLYPDSDDETEIAKVFVEHINSTAHSLYRRDQLFSLVKVMPYWEFNSNSFHSPPECKALHGTVLPYTDKFWSTHLPPCARIPCRCYIHALSERDIKRRAT